MDEVTVYDQGGKLLTVLDNADAVSYELKHNDLWTGSFSLPTGDPKNVYCQAHNLVRLPDGNRDTGIYRIIGMPSAEETAAGGMREYSVEHVMATLLDDVLSELDPRRQEYVLNRIRGGQVFITCCENDRLDTMLRGRVFHIRNGEVL